MIWHIKWFQHRTDIAQWPISNSVLTFSDLFYKWPPHHQKLRPLTCPKTVLTCQLCAHYACIQTSCQEQGHLEMVNSQYCCCCNKEPGWNTARNCIISKYELKKLKSHNPSCLWRLLWMELIVILNTDQILYRTHKEHISVA